MNKNHLIVYTFVSGYNRKNLGAYADNASQWQLFFSRINSWIEPISILYHSKINPWINAYIVSYIVSCPVSMSNVGSLSVKSNPAPTTWNTNQGQGHQLNILLSLNNLFHNHHPWCNLRQKEPIYVKLHCEIFLIFSGIEIPNLFVSVDLGSRWSEEVSVVIVVVVIVDLQSRFRTARMIPSNTTIIIDRFSFLWRITSV